MKNCDQLKSDFEKFLLFQCENKSINPDVLISSTINLMKNCVSSREAISQFYYQFFDDLCYLYLNKQNLDLNNTNTLLSRFLKYYNETDNKSTKFNFKVKTENTSISNDTPLSPPLQIEHKTVTELNFFQTISKYIVSISKTLEELLQNEDEESKKILIDWIIKLLSSIPAKYSKPNEDSLVERIKIWTNCNVIISLLNLIKTFIMSDSYSNINFILTKLLKQSPNSDWITAYLITLLPNDKNKISYCIQFLLSSGTLSSSIISMLAYLSEHNPQAIIESTKSDIGFLIKLSTTSKPLLNLLTTEISKQANIDVLNNLVLEEDLKNEALYCIFNASNSFELLKLLFETSLNPSASVKVKNQAFVILEMVTHKLHQTVYCCSDKMEAELPLIKELRNNSKEIVCQLLINSSENKLHKIQIRIVHLLCVNYGIEFTSDVLFNFLNNFNINFDHDINLNSSKTNIQLLTDLLNSLRLPFESSIQQCFNNFIEDISEKNPRFWANLYKILESGNDLKIELDIVSSKFAEVLSQQNNNLYSLYYILLIIRSCLEKQPVEATKSNHHLCISLSASLIQIIGTLNNGHDYEKKIIIVNLIQKCMLILSKSHQSNRHIICRALIESEVNSDEISSIIEDQLNLSLLNENATLNSTFKFRKIPLLSGSEIEIKKNLEKNFFLRNQIILDTIRSCCANSPELLASLLVETLTPDVMFNDKTFPDEDFLKVTIERDLHITRKFESHPILWNLVEMIAKEGCLKNCSLLISALLAVQLTQWSSPTANKDKLVFTKKLIQLVSNSEMIPDVPFKFLPLVLDYLNSWEIYCVLNDFWRFLKENYSTENTSSLHSKEPKFQVIKHYFERLRIISCQKLPGKLYVKIFKNFS